MKLKFSQLLILSALLLTLFSCDGCNNNGPGCDGIWIADYPNPSFIAEVDSVNKTMSLQVASMAPNTSGYQGEVYQAYFTGDFDVQAPFSNFVASYSATDGNPYAEMIMYNSATPDSVLDTTFVRAGISRDYIYASIGLQTDKQLKLPTTTSGTMRIRKIGSSILARVIAGGDTVQKNISFTFNPVRFSLRLGSFNDSSVTNTTAIKFNAFNVSGTSGATLFSDQFTCNSIYVP